MAGPIAAIVLAAGFSQRMGEFKPLLPLGGETVLERCVALFRTAGVDDIRVVTGHRAAELEPLLARLGVRNVVNARYREGMFSSVAAGLATIEKDVEAFFVLPADIPLVRPATVRRLLNGFDPSKHDAVYPVFRGERGHPPLIAGRLAEDIASWHGGGGLKAALAELASASLEVDVADGNILLDMDSPDDYRLLQEKALRLEIPTPEECRALLEGVLGVAEPVIRHGKAVADIALRLGKALNQAGCDLNIPLLEAAALLHDLAKGKPDHPRLGAEILVEQGFSTVARPVATHMDITVNEAGKIGVAEVVYLADKLVQGDRQISLAERFRPKIERYAGDPALLAAVNRRLETAMIVKKVIEDKLGKSVEEVLSNGQ